MAKVLFIIFFLLLSLASQSQKFNFRTFFVDDGLAQSQVRDIDADSYGNIWLATYGGGVDCFDGISFKNYGLKEGMAHHQVLDIYVDNNNVVWCGLQRGGLSKITDNQIKTITNSVLEKNAVNALVSFNETIFAATSNGHLYKILNNAVPKLVHSFTNTSINDLYATDSSIIIATENKGIWSYHKNQTTLLSEIKQARALNATKNNIWVAAGHQLFTINLQTKKVKLKAKANNIINDIEPDKRGDIIWLSIYGSGLGQYAGGQINYLSEANGLASNYTLSVFRDAYGLLWIGTDGAGLSRFSGFQFVHYTFSNKNSGEAIMNILKDGNTFWFASYGSGIIKKKGNKKTFYNKKTGLPTNTFYAIEKTDKNHLWMTTRADGLVCLNTETNKITHLHNKNSIISNHLLHLQKSPDGNLYVSSRDKGIFIRRKDSWVQISQKNGLPDNHINYLLFDKKGSLWIATGSSGIVRIKAEELKEFFKSKNRIIEYDLFKTQQEVVFQQVFTLTQDKNGIIWFGLFGGGIGYIKNEEVHFMRLNRRLNSQNIYGLAYDQNHNKLWTGTDKGIAYIKLTSKSVPEKIQNFSSGDGFIGVECNRNAMFYDTLENNLWVGTVKGVTRFMPSEYNPPEIEPRLRITNFTYQEKELPIKTFKIFRNINWKEAPKINYDSNSVVIKFKGIDQWQPDKVKYKWVLIGLNDYWHELSKQQIVEYNFLPPGEYVFKLKAINGRGNWSEHSIYLPFIIKTPFKQTTTFFILIGIAVLSIIILYVYLRQLSLRRRNRKLKEAVYERTEALNNEKLTVEQQKEELRAQTEHLEQANRELEKLSLVASKTDNAVLIADKNAKWEWINEGFKKMYGYQLNEFIDERGDSILNSSTSNKIKHILEEAVKLKKSVTFSAKGYKKDKTEMWVQSTLTPIFDDKGNLKRYVVIDTDITHIKKINTELRKLSLVASKTDNSVIMMNNKGKIEWVNDAFHRFYDLSLEEFKSLYQRTFHDLHKGIKGLFDAEAIIKSEQSKSFISSFVTRKGTHKWIQSVVTPVAGSTENGETQLIAIETDITRIKEVEEEVKEQRKKSEELLLNILPAETAEELKSQGQAMPRYYNSASVMFGDFFNFTAYCEKLSPQQLVAELREYFNKYDDIIETYYVEKIKTIGDAYMCAGGLPIRNRSHAFDIVLTALAIQIMTQKINAAKKAKDQQAWELRIGIHTGDLVAGVVGKKKFAYDIWGDTVNIASRMESACDVGRINISGDTYNIIKDYFVCTYRGKIEAKNIGKFDMYFVDGIKPDYSIDGLGAEPNNTFREFLASL